MRVSAETRWLQVQYKGHSPLDSTAPMLQACGGMSYAYYVAERTSTVRQSRLEKGMQQGAGLLDAQAARR